MATIKDGIMKGKLMNGHSFVGAVVLSACAGVAWSQACADNEPNPAPAQDDIVLSDWYAGSVYRSQRGSLDRRPMYWISGDNNYGGPDSIIDGTSWAADTQLVADSTCDLPFEVDTALPTVLTSGSNGVQDGFDKLIQILNIGYNAGWRRFMIDKPGGEFDIDWTEMDQADRDDYLDVVRDWILAHPDVGIDISYESYELPTSGFTSPADMEDFLEDFWPWVQVGVDRVFLESTYNDPDILKALNESPLLFDPDTGHRTWIGGEMGAPGASSGVFVEADSYDVDWFAAHQNPFWSSPHFPLSTQVDPKANEIVVVESGQLNGRFLTIEDMYDAVRTGKTIVPYYLSHNWAKRIYEFGVVSMPADFNGDGVLTGADITLFTDMQTFAIANPFTGPNTTVSVAKDPLFFEGDYDRDGDVDSNDYSVFIADFLSGGGASIDFGPSEQPPLWANHR